MPRRLTTTKDGTRQALKNSSFESLVVAFARNANWGYVMPAFSQKKRKLNHESHEKFGQSKNAFLKAFHKI